MSSPLLHRLVPSAVMLAIVFCTTASVIPRPASLSDSESQSPLEEEEERESQEESVEVYAGGRQFQRLLLDLGPCRPGSIPIVCRGQNPRTRDSGCCLGHRLSDGHSAPIVC